MVANRPRQSNERDTKCQLPHRLHSHVVLLSTAEQAQVRSQITAYDRIYQQVISKEAEPLLGILPGVCRDRP